MNLTFAHICIKTRNLEKTEEFYTQALGMEKIFDFMKNEKRRGFYLKISDRHFIEVFEQADLENKPSAIVHFCLETKDMDKTLEHLNKHNVETSKKTFGPDNSYQAWIKDPNGIRIELHEYTNNSKQLTEENVNLPL